MAFAIVRTKRLKNNDALGQALAHNLRSKFADNVDPKKSKNNVVLVDEFNLANGGSLSDSLASYYDGLGVKAKANNVKMMEFVAAASPNFFNNKTPEQVSTWCNDQVEFFQKKFPGRVKMAVVHMDESSPHVHFFVSVEHTTTKKYKNRYGECEKESTTLNSKRYNRQFLSELQTEFAAHNKKWGLQRGLKGSSKVHTAIKEFRKEVSAGLNKDYGAAIDKLFQSIKPNLFGNIKKEEVLANIKPVFDKLAKQNKALKIFFKKSYAQLVRDVESQEKQLNKIKEKLEAERVEIAERKELYIEAVNTKLADFGIISNLKNEVEGLKKQVIELGGVPGGGSPGGSATSFGGVESAEKTVPTDVSVAFSKKIR